MRNEILLNGTSRMNYRTRMRRIRRAKLVITWVGILVVSLLLIQGFTHKNVIDGNISYQFKKEFVEVSVAYKDTLWDIATKQISTGENKNFYTVDTLIDEIKSTNGIKGDYLVAGRSISIPVMVKR